MLQAADLTIRLHPDDDVVIARMEIATGTLAPKEKVSTLVTIPAGHKLAVRDIGQGQPCTTSPWAILRAITPIALRGKKLHSKSSRRPSSA
jgi:altronate hydrolase